MKDKQTTEVMGLVNKK